MLVNHQLIVNNFFRQGIVSRQQIVNRQSSIVNISSAWQKIHLFCAVFRLFPGIGVGLCYLCMRDALRKVLHFLAFQLFKKFFKKSFAVWETSVYLHSTNKQNDKMIPNFKTLKIGVYVNTQPINVKNTPKTTKKNDMNAQIKKEFKEWMNDGNVVKINGTFRTQDAQYKNRIADMKALMAYYIKEFCI